MDILLSVFGSPLPSLGYHTAEFSSGAFVKKHNNVGNPAVPSNEEISPGVSWHLTKAARYPFNPSVIAQLLGRGNGLILKVRVSGPELACDAVDLVSAAEYTPQDRKTRNLRCRSRRWQRVDALGRFHRRRREDCGSARSICWRTRRFANCR